MRHAAPSSVLPRPPEKDEGRAIVDTVKSLFPYLWAYRFRVFFALACLVIAKLANVSVPLVFKNIIDSLNLTEGQALIVVPASLLLAYGIFRFSASFFTELREMVFARVTQEAVRAITLKVFGHLHALSLRFHLERQTGGLTRDIERGTRSIGALISYTLYSILPTLIEIGLVIGILWFSYDAIFTVITLITLSAYIVFTVKITEWRTQLRREANELDSAANTRAVDSLINFETVKYFNNEAFEAQRYDHELSQWMHAQIKNQISLALLNMGQAAIIAVGVTLMMWQAAERVLAGQMSLGDIVLVNAFMIQLYIPLNFLGVIYRELRQALTDIERMFGLLETQKEIADAPDAQALAASHAAVRFEHVGFAYDQRRPILFDIDFEIPAGHTVAVVGASGSGKSTLARLLFRFYDVSSGYIRINGEDIRTLTQDSVRRAIGIVPQDTVLFNDTLYYNIEYGRPGADRKDVLAVLHAAQLSDFVAQLPDGLQTKVGERGLKLSGGEKQRVAIARALLKDPPILIFDEATSALDSSTEKAIQGMLDAAASGRTALVIAHRLSTVMKADSILVMAQGRIIERGRHAELLALKGEYARMWALQAEHDDMIKASASARQGSAKEMQGE
jgi:ATP-binding cassette, subfamily B, heavy metal transporter